MKKYLLLLLILGNSIITQAQNITGTWEGIMGDEFLQINIKQQGTSICGYSYDYVLSNKNNFCKAYYTGKYVDGLLIISGTGFVAKSWNHVLMKMSMLVKYNGDEMYLKGKVLVGAADYSGIGLRTGTVVTLRRVSTKPTPVPGTKSPCFTNETKILKDNDPGSNPDTIILPRVTPKPVTPKPVTPKPVTPKPVTPKPVTPKPVTPKPITPKPVIKDSVKPKPVLPIVKPLPLPPRIAERKNVEQGKITVTENKINLKMYDNGVVDGDTITVYYNGKLIVNKQKLSEKPIDINLTLDENAISHEITLFAENLGGIPPNTALIVVTAGKKRYELRSSADLTKNAVLIFKYEPQ